MNRVNLDLLIKLFGSYNLNDVFNDKMVENLMHKFEGINIPENNFEIKMTRKRK